MAEGVQTTDGRPVEINGADVEREFARAMSADVSADVPAPPRKPESDPAAPKPKRGRPPKSEAARTSMAVPAPSKGKPAEAVKPDYTADAQNLVGTVWTVSASIPYTQPYAAVVYGNSDALASALAEGAKHNSTIRQWVSGGGGNMWMLQLASVGLSMGMQAMQLMRDPVLRDKARAATQEQLKAAFKAQGIEIPEMNPVDDSKPQ